MSGQNKMTIRELQTFGKTYKPFNGQAGLYVSRVLDELSSIKLTDFVHKYALAEMSEEDFQELHCTIIGSPDCIVRDLTPVNQPCAARVIRFEFWEGHDNAGYLVAILQSQALQQIHTLWQARGATHTFEEYQPHITIQTPYDMTGERQNFLHANCALQCDPMLIYLHKEIVEDCKQPSVE